MIGGDRYDHRFLLGQPGGAFYVGQVDREHPTHNLPGGSRWKLTSSYDPAANLFWVIDLGKHERSPTNALDLAVTSWSAYTTPALPVVQATFYLDAAEAGNRFTVHSRAPGGVDRTDSIVADALWAPLGSWDPGHVDTDGTIHTTDHTDTEITIPPGGAWFRAPLGRGMEFWITRDDDETFTPHQTVDYIGAPQWTLFGAFLPPLPPPPPPSYTFHIPVGGGSVVHADGLVIPVTIDSTPWLYAYDDYGNVSELTQFAIGHASPDPAQVWWFVGNDGSRAPDYTFDVFEWHPTGHAVPPPVAAGSLEMILPDWLWNAHLKQNTWNFEVSYSFDWQLADVWNGYINIPVAYGGREDLTYEAMDGNGQVLYSLPAHRVHLPYDANQPFWIEDGTGAASQANQTNLGAWLAAPQPRQLAISSSRWAHHLRLTQPDGGSWPVVQHATQGDFSITQTGAAWWNSYYWFDATAQRHDALPWRIEDRDTEEATLLFQPGDTPDLITWFSLPDSHQLTAVHEGGQIVLRWDANSADPTGGFGIERSVGSSGVWTHRASPYAGDVIDPFTGLAQWSEPLPNPLQTMQYRLYYAFGGGHSARSNVASINLQDSDHDGLPDAWELLYGFAFNNLTAPDGAGDADGDGVTNLDEYHRGTSPKDFYDGVPPPLRLSGHRRSLGRQAASSARRPPSLAGHSMSKCTGRAPRTRSQMH